LFCDCILLFTDRKISDLGNLSYIPVGGNEKRVSETNKCFSADTGGQVAP